MQNEFGVTVGLRAAFEDEVARGLKGGALVKVWCHGTVVRVAGVLPINHGRHALQRRRRSGLPRHLDQATTTRQAKVGDLLRSDGHQRQRQF